MLLETLRSRSQFAHNSSIKTFDISTLYTTIPYTLQKYKLKNWFSVASQRSLHVSNSQLPHSDFLYSAQLLTQKRINQGYIAPRLKSSLNKLYRHHNLVDRYEISIFQMTIDLLHFTKMFSFLYHCQCFYWTWLYICVA